LRYGLAVRKKFVRAPTCFVVFQKSKGLTLEGIFIEEFIRRPSGFTEAFNRRFPSLTARRIAAKWIVDQNTRLLSTHDLRPCRQNNMKTIFLEMTSDAPLQDKFRLTPPVEFWCSSKDEYPQLSQKVVLAFLLFTTDCTCEHSQRMYRQKRNTATDLMPNPS